MLEGSLWMPEPQSWVGVATGSAAAAACLCCWQPELRTGLHRADPSGLEPRALERGPYLWQGWPRTFSEG